MIPYAWFEDARRRLSPHINKTPLAYDKALDLYLKWENHQVTGSFKIRGALNFVLSLSQKELKNGLVAASAGNHGKGLALAASQVNATATIFTPQNAVPSKSEAIRRLGANLILVPGGYGEAEKAAMEYAADRKMVWVSPYNNRQVIAGQGSLGLEILEDVSHLDHSVWIVPVGGGGLISGIAATIKEGKVDQSRKRYVVGVQSVASPFMHALFHRGSQGGLLELPSLADGLSGPVEENSITIPLVQRYVDDLVLVSEEEITQAIAYAWERYEERIEGSAAVALAAVLSNKVSFRPAIVVLSGGNIQNEVHAEIIQTYGHHSR